MAEMGLLTLFVMALADETARQYRLYVEPQREPGVGCVLGDAQALAAQVDRHLQLSNIEYRAKRDSARLEPLCAFWLRAGTETAFRQACVAQGQREGQFKTVALSYRAQLAFDLDACVASPDDSSAHPTDQGEANRR